MTAEFDYSDLMRNNERSISADFERSKSVAHAGDRGENREEFLRTFLERFLPAKYGFAKGQVVTKTGQRSHAVDIIVYDRVSCPIFYAEHTKIIPIEGVYGIIEVKSRLSKSECVNALNAISNFKKMAPRDLGIVSKDNYVTMRRPSRPFGVVFGYTLDSNSLESLKTNYEEFNKNQYYVDQFANLITVIGEGNIYLQGIRWEIGEKFHLINTDDIVNFIEQIDYHRRNRTGMENCFLIKTINEPSEDSLGRFISYLQVVLSRMLLVPPDLGLYMGTDLPTMIVKEG